MKQVKIRSIYARNKFYEGVLWDWKESVDDHNFRSVLSRALINLKVYPLKITCIADLKNVRGIGENIARKLEGAWDVFCSQNSAAPTVKQVSQIKKGEFLQFINSVNTLEQRSGARITTATKIANEVISTVDPVNVGSIVSELNSENLKPTSSGLLKRPSKTVKPPRSWKAMECRSNKSGGSMLPTNDIGCHTVEHISNSHFDGTNPEYSAPREQETTVFYHPSTFGRSQVVLIVDNRENANTRNFQRMCNFFQEKGLVYEMRSLSVGDYLWILRMYDGTEMVLDYIAERKTLSDLWSSIKQKRYEEQKQRLMSVGIPNVIYFLEGSAVPKPAAEQALITSHVENRFLVYRTNNIEHTSLVLSVITERLRGRASTQELTGMSFEHFQKVSKKTQCRSVRDLFLRQLTVCPQMSVQKASLIVDRLPSFAALTSFYKSIPKEQRTSALSDNIPGITKRISINVAKFYSSV